MDLKGKGAIVTGAASGIGRATALKLAGLGAAVLVNDVETQGLEETVKLIEQMGGKALSFRGDVSKSDEVQKMVKGCVEGFGGVDILVNNAGVARSALLLKLDEQQWDQVMAVNLKGVYLCTRAVAPYMVEQRYGKIVNISSIYGRIGAIGDSNYAASKAGVIGFTKSVAKELARYNINVNAVLPGMIDTPLLRGIPEKYLKRMLEEVPFRRIGRPEEIASVVAFLASDEASYITGAAIEVTGGWNM